ncbi:MAG: protein kinase [Gemmatimonadaceae bacterium]|nr:protein kinase [Gemmatimonadaceae bacterium]
MASVFLALDLALDRKVAIKVMSPALMSTPGAIDRFRREARVAAGLSHPHIVPIHAIGEEPGLAYYVMKYIEGRSLDSVIRHEGGQSLAFTQAIIGYMGNALHYAHQRGVVHRDVKPANVMLDREGWVYVTDFGIAKQTEGAGLTHSGVIIGTPHYMSPEQFNGQPVTGAADQYALGVLAYELLTGRTPYSGPSIGEVMKGHLFEPVPAMRVPHDEIPASVEACVQRMLAKDPAERYASVAEAVAAFGALSATMEFETKSRIARFADEGAREQPQLSVPTSPVPSFRPTVHHSEAHAADTRPMTSPNLTPRAPLAAATPARSRRGLWLGATVLAAAGVVAAMQFGPWSPGGTGSVVPPGDTGAVQSGAGTPGVPLAVVGAGDSTTGDTTANTPAKTPTKTPTNTPANTPTNSPVGPPVDNPDSTPATSPATTPAPSPGAGRGTRLPLGGKAITKALDRLEDRNEQRVAAGKDPIVPALGWIKIGSRIPLATLYVNEQPAVVIGGKGPRLVTVRAGQARVSLRADGCANWDTTLTVASLDTAVIGFRAPRCP